MLNDTNDIIFKILEFAKKKKFILLFFLFLMQSTQHTTSAVPCIFFWNRINQS